uniref:Interleukin-1 n=1 Tax=Plecoglossus altivelis TaxID=61084 RepID=N0EBB4_PLEAT|nr:Interleukin-1 beta [Plecoglossus altivelis]
MEFEMNKCPTMVSPGLTWRSKMPHGVDLEISHHPFSMRKVADIIIALERLRGHQNTLSSEVRDEDLLGMMLETVMEEKMVIRTGDDMDEEMSLRKCDCKNNREEIARTAGFEKGQVVECSLVDCDKKHWVLMAMELQAVRLQNGNDHRKVRLNLSSYRPPSSTQGARPVTLAIKGTQLYLSCSNSSGKPTLVLEEVTEDLTTISPGSDKLRFLFYRRDTGVDSSTLMSARYTGWYISTGVQDGVDRQSVDMCELPPRQRCTNFTVIN